MVSKQAKEAVEEGKALIEMYKAGFLDGYKIHNKLRKKEDWITLNRFYKLAFNKRFGKRITKELKKREKK